MEKIMSTVLAVIILCTVCLTGCAKESPAVLTYGETSVTEAMYSYYVSTYKGRYIQAYSDITDSDEFFDSDMGGKTGEDIMKELVYGNVAQNLVAAEEFRRAGLSLSEDDISSVDSYIESMIDELAEGSRKTFNGYLSEFGVNADMLREMFLMERTAYAYYEYLYGEDGTVKIEDSEKDAYYKENYVRFDQIFINNVLMYETDEDGSFIQDTSGNYVTRELTEEEAKDAADRISSVKTGLESGEDFAALKEEYSDSKDYKRGYYFSAATSTEYITSVVSAALALEEGEWTYVEAAADRGAFFIKRLPLEKGAYKDEDLSDFFSTFDENLTSEKYSAELEALYGDIVKDDEFLSTVSVKNAPANYYYY